ncbi:ABC transporter ATP-binding protein [Mycetocola reblochoni]|uniref:ABC transporter ATP-binding protein n=2 Tax=Mycetocola reblochoni TaxID=331618 RepID=A0A1R4IN73_9MICO|nr:ABC transporter ATP-binding protein [Mycetocola reblochoni]RLP67912.1 ABC transporter ATP-binding protein [Mycetocola reblochoni]SJN21198.1 ABC transporter ATP-binding protein [Mycetocola reblochoni REB411]
MIRRLYDIADAAARRRLVAYLALTAIAILLVSATLVLVIPLVRALFSADPTAAVPVIVAIAGTGLAALAVDMVSTVYGERSGAALILRMHEVIGERIMRLPIGWFDGERIGAISTLTSRGVAFAANAPNSFLRPVWQATAVPLIVAVAVVVVDPAVGAAMLLGGIAVVLVWSAVRRREGLLRLRSDEMNEAAGARVLEFASAQPAVRAAGPDSLAERAVREAVAAQRAATERVLSASNRGMALYDLVAYGTMLVVVGVLVWRTVQGGLDGPTAVALLILQVVATWFASHGLPFGEGIDTSNRTLAQIDRLMTAEVLPEPDTPAAPRDAGVAFADVTFGYLPEQPVLNGVSFEAPSGGMTAIVGPSGSGKSTIARLIARFVDVQAGSVRIGGVDVRELGTRATLAQVSVVFQDVYLFEDTLRENIRLGRPDADDAEVEEVARRAGVSEIADRLPDGLDTRVGESGGTLSGGERQRVSIARALLKDAPIVLLDEATAALDVESEALIQRGLAELAGRKTLIVIAHRLQTIRQAERIVVLDGRGGVEAVGDHATLLATSPSYARFWTERSGTLDWRIDAG